MRTATETKLSVGDKCRICVDWTNSPDEIVRITKFQKNGGQIFAKVKWKTNSMEEVYGCLFNLDELKRVG